MNQHALGNALATVLSRDRRLRHAVTVRYVGLDGDISDFSDFSDM